MKFDRQKLIKDIKASGFRKDYICAKAGIHRSFLWMITNGTRDPSQETIKKIYEVLLGKAA
jgi:transcriptional regulator with XRE-family HTH domain